jgi:DNA repair protein RecN (Recombination protein N)
MGADCVRSGAAEAEIEAALDLSGTGRTVPESWGGGAELVVRRVIQADGRSRCWVNGCAATVSGAAAFLSELLDISSQHAHQELLREESHLEVLDSFCGSGRLLGKYGAARASAVAACSELSALKQSLADRASREDFLSFQLKEISAAAPVDGEDERLAAERMVLQNSGKLIEAASAAEQALYSGDGSAIGLVKKAASRLAGAAALDQRLGEAASLLEQAAIPIEEAATFLRSYLSGSDFSPSTLDEVEERLAVLSRLIRKYAGQGGTSSDLVRKRGEIAAELELLKGGSDRIEELESRAEKSVRECIESGRTLGEMRRSRAGALASGVTAAMRKVALTEARFVVEVDSSTPSVENAVSDSGLLPERGFETASFKFSANPGEPPKPLFRIASGGELSRMMLAVKWALSGRDPVLVYVFDEVDSGIGGAAAEVVGRHLREISKHRQVICITHLAQIAALGDGHVNISKTTSKGRTVVSAEKLDGDSRKEELARMLAGVNVTPATMAHAAEMMGKTGNKGNPCKR